MGEHRKAGGGRGVSRGLVVLAVAVVVVLALGFLWALLGERINEQGKDAAARCVEGDLSVSIVSDPGLAVPLKAVADKYNKTRPTERDRCITIEVRPGDAKVTLDGLTGDWDTASRGQFPAAWIPQSSVWSSQLIAARPDVIDGSPSSLVTSPVVLAIPAAAAEAMDGDVGWIELPTLQRSAKAMEDLGLRGWGELRMAMPVGPQSDATMLAAQAIATEVSRTPSGPLSPEDAASPRVSSTLRAMLASAPATDLGSSESGVRNLQEEADPATGRIQAVPITEQQLYAITKDHANSAVVELFPFGPTPMADFPVVTITGDQVDAAQRDAIGAFIDYVRDPQQISTITSLGFRGAGQLPPATSTVTFPVTPTPMPMPAPEAQNAITEILYRRS